MRHSLFQTGTSAITVTSFNAAALQAHTVKAAEPAVGGECCYNKRGMSGMIFAQTASQTVNKPMEQGALSCQSKKLWHEATQKCVIGADTAGGHTWGHHTSTCPWLHTQRRKSPAPAGRQLPEGAYCRQPRQTPRQ